MRRTSVSSRRSSLVRLRLGRCLRPGTSPPQNQCSEERVRLQNANAARAGDAIYPFRVGLRGYEHWESDLREIIDLDFDLYRLSISWARLFPNGFEDEHNTDGVAYYDRVIRCLTDAGIRAFITINHYVLPVAVVDKYGGWKNRDVIDLYLKMAEYVVGRWREEVNYCLLINEINAEYFSPFNGFGITGSDDHVYGYEFCIQWSSLSNGSTGSDCADGKSIVDY